MHSDITFIASDLLAAEKVQNILRESPANCQVVLSNTQDLEEVSRSQVAQGAKVLIAFGMFAKIVRQSVDVPVIMVDLQAEDVMDALLEASKLGKRIAIFGFRRVLKDVFYVRDLLSIVWYGFLLCPRKRSPMSWRRSRTSMYWWGATIRPGSPSSTGSRLYSSRPGIPRSERPSLWPSPIWKSGRMNPRPGPP